MKDNFCPTWDKVKEKYAKEYVGLVLTLKDIDYRYVISFNERIDEYNQIKTINYVRINVTSSTAGGVKIESIKPISKKDLTPKEVTYLFSYPADVFSDTTKFQVEYGLMKASEINAEQPYFIDKDKLNMKIGHLKEELAEIEKAASEGDLAEFADGIIDLIYVAAGLGALCRLPMNTLWNDVQNSNMVGKVRVTSLENATKRGSTFDVRKGPNWVGPRGKDIIETFTKLRNNLQLL